MRRLLLGGVALAALIAAGLAPAPPGPDPLPTYRPVTSSVLACPELVVTDDSADVLGAVVAADGGTASGAGSAALRPIGAPADLARISGPDQPLGLLVAEKSQPPIVMRALQSWAPSALAGVAVRDLSGGSAGISSVACARTDTEWWFVGAGSQLGRGAALLVTNPAREPARFDIALFARSGPVEALAGRGIDLGAQQDVRLRLDALAPDQDLLAVRVRATSGGVVAAVRDVAVPRGESPRGVDYIGPAIPPALDLVIGGIPGGEGQRELLLVNPGTQFATVRTRLLTSQGSRDIPGLPTVAVPAGSVIVVRLDQELEGESGSLVLTSDVPVTGTVRSSWGGARRDVMWLAASRPASSLNPLAGAGAVPAGPGLVTTVTVAAPAGEVAGTLSVMTTGSAQDSIFRADWEPAGGGAATPASGAATPANGAGTPAEDAGGATAAEGPGATADAGGTEGPGGSGAPSPGSAGDDAGGPVPIVPPGTTQSFRITVPAGTQRTVTVPGTEASALATLVWHADSGSAPSVVSHVTLDPAGPLATGYQWWAATSAVPATPVREDVGTLAPTG